MQKRKNDNLLPIPNAKNVDKVMCAKLLDDRHVEALLYNTKNKLSLLTWLTIIIVS